MLTGKDWIFAPLVASKLSDDDDERDQIVKELIDDDWRLGAVNTDTIKILYKEPGKAPEIREIENDLKPMQELVGGYIETVRLGDDILIVCNEMGKFDCMDPNFYVEAIDDLIVGPAFFCRADGVEFTDIGDNDAKWICKRLGWGC